MRAKPGCILLLRAKCFNVLFIDEGKLKFIARAKAITAFGATEAQTLVSNVCYLKADSVFSVGLSSQCNVAVRILGSVHQTHFLVPTRYIEA